MLKEVVSTRINWLFAIIAACLAVITAQLYYIQIIQHDIYTNRSHSNRTRLIRDRAQRGRITDRFGRQLATTKPSFSLYITPEDFPRDKRQEAFQRLGDILEKTSDDIRDRYRKSRAPSYRPRKIMGNLSDQQVVQIETSRYYLPGVSVEAENIRAYPYHETLCHILGYVGEISGRQLELPEYEGYRVADIIGKTGIEKIHERILNGQDGYRWVEVDATGRQGRTLRYPAPKLAIPGAELELTIDLDLQKSCEKYLADWKGAIVAMDPSNGDVLAMVSNPGYNPNWFASGMTTQQWRSINDNPDKPLLNRCIQFQEPPGSVFKVITALAGYQSGNLIPETTYFCNGAFSFSKHIYRCWNRYGHGTVDLRHALEGSCNVFFYQLGLKVGIDSLNQVAADFALGQKTGIGLPNEKTGFVPSREWKKRRYNDEWWPGETISVSIGQGGVTTTPLQLGCLMAMAANRGIMYQPRLVRSVVGRTARDSRELEPRIIHTHSASETAWDEVVGGLELVVSGKQGTARKMRMREMTAAGKTGTAQVISSRTLKKMGYDSKNPAPQKYWDHNWFAGFGPVEEPGIVVVIALENGGKEGAKEKITIARKVFLRWYELNHEGLEGPIPPPPLTEQSNSTGVL